MYRCASRSRLRSCTRHLRTQPRYDYDVRLSGEPSSFSHRSALATPRQLVQYLDEYVIGQETAKKVLSVAVFNHYCRVRANLARAEEEDDMVNWDESPAEEVEISPALVQPHPYRIPLPSPLPLRARHTPSLLEKSNVLVIGPTGSGKTLLARTLAKVLDVPFSVSDATSFTQAGYVGDDVDMCINRLLQAANWDERRASTGIVYIDEVDKIARKTGGLDGQRDVGGEGVQQALLRMMEGTTVSIQAKGVIHDSIPLGGSGRARTGQRGQSASELRSDTFSIDTSNVLFILSGAFVGLDKVLEQRMSKGSIGFGATLSRSSKETRNQFPFFTSNRKATANILDHVEPSDIVKYGFIPEFISRLPTITTLSPLTTQDLLRILTDVRGSLVSQYTALFGYSGVEVRFTRTALREICKKAFDRGGGARGLRGIMEVLLLEAMYEVPGSSVKHVLINKAVARGESPPLYWSKGEGASFWAAWAEEEAQSDAGTET